MFASAKVLGCLQLFAETIILRGLKVYLVIYRQIDKNRFSPIAADVTAKSCYPDSAYGGKFVCVFTGLDFLAALI